MSSPMTGSELSTPTRFFWRRTAESINCDTSYSTNVRRSGVKKGMLLVTPKGVCTTRPKKKLSSSVIW